MAKLFKLYERPDRSIKSKSTGKYLDIRKYPTNSIVPDDWDVNEGDVLSWDDYRASQVDIVTADRRLERNPDKSGAGYLTIPLSITSRFPNAVEHYSQVLHEIDAINVSSIEISATDGFFRSNFSKIALPEEICRRADLSFSYNPQEDVLHVECRSANNLSQCFPIVGTKTDEIVQWISHLDQPRTSFIVNYQLQGENYHRCPKGVVSGLPEGWQCESHGGASAGPDHIEGQWKCHGPTSTKNDARKAIEQFYKSASIDISASTIIIDEN